MSSIATANSGGIVVKAAQCIRDNKEYLSTIDGLIGDGDHGINTVSYTHLTLPTIRLV